MYVLLNIVFVFFIYFNGLVIALRPFKINCAPPNLVIRTWLCRLNFAQRLFFSGLRFFNEPEIQIRDPQLKVPPGGLVLRIFTSWKNPSTLSDLKPWILDLEASTLPQDHRGQHNNDIILVLVVQIVLIFFCLKHRVRGSLRLQYDQWKYCLAASSIFQSLLGNLSIGIQW